MHYPILVEYQLLLHSGKSYDTMTLFNKQNNSFLERRCTVQKWEYAALTMPDSRTVLLIFFKIPHSEVHRLGTDKAMGDRNIADVQARVMAQLGLDGWEIAASGGEDTTATLTFKRPLP